MYTACYTKHLQNPSNICSRLFLADRLDLSTSASGAMAPRCSINGILYCIVNVELVRCMSLAVVIECLSSFYNESSEFYYRHW